MQVKMHKYLFVGTERIHERFFEKAQKLGFMEFISVTGKKPHLFPKDIEDAKAAIKILSKHSKGKQHSDAPIPITEIINDIITGKEKIDIAYEQKRMNKLELARVKPLGNFSIDDIHAIEEESTHQINFLMMRHDRIPASEIPKELIHISREANMDYFFYIGEEKFNHHAFTHIEISKSYNVLLGEYQDLEVEIGLMEQAEIDACAYITLIEEYIFARMNSINLNFAKEDIDYLLYDKLFMIEAWVPEGKAGDVENFSSQFPVIAEKVCIEKGDEPPTHLKNKGFSRMGEDLIYVYDTPSVEDKDPSRWVLWFFTLFFGMIIADAGYGMIFLSVAIFCWMKYGKTLKGIKRRMLKILTLISSWTVVWGVLIASYFSVTLAPDSFLNKISIPYNLAIEKVDFHKNKNTELYKEWLDEYPQITDVEKPEEILNKGIKIMGKKKSHGLMEDIYGNIFLELSLIVGIIHLCTSFARNLYRSWSGIGWIFTLLGGYLYFPKILEGYSMLVYTGVIDRGLSIIIGEQMLYGGLIGAVLLAIIQERSLSGLVALFKAIEVFADSLSYLRLYALGLASMVLAGTFNEIGPDIGGPMFGWIIILLGHIVNITLGVMAGVIHGLRLNFLEWYHHCYEGGGRKFSPLRLLKGN